MIPIMIDVVTSFGTNYTINANRIVWMQDTQAKGDNVVHVWLDDEDDQRMALRGTRKEIKALIKKETQEMLGVK